MESTPTRNEIAYQKPKNAFGASFGNDKKKVYTVLGFSSLLALVGSLLIIPSFKEPSLGLFIWFSLVLGVDLMVLKQLFNKININGFTGLLLLSYSALTLGFMLNTKSHILNIFLIMVLFTVLNANLITNVFRTNFIARYFTGGLFLLGSRIAGIFLFLIDLVKIQKHETKGENKYMHYAKIALKSGLIFLVTGLPVIIIAVSLLKTANAEYAKWIDSVFSWNFTLQNLIPRIIFILFVAPYLITETYFLKELSNNKHSIRNSKLKVNVRDLKYVVAVATATVLILNLFYILFIIAELRYDISDVRDLLLKKNYDTYSEFAVNRFWELIFVTMINLGVVYFLAKPFKKVASVSKKISLAFMINAGFLFLNSLFLMYSAHKRLSLYEEGYGFTNKRLLAHSFVFVLLIITFMLFATLWVKRQSLLMRYAFGVAVLFFAMYIMLPTDYITSRLNYNMVKSGNVVVYDPLYSNRSDFYSNSVVSSNGIESDDGLFISIKLLNDKDAKLSDNERTALQQNLLQFQRENENLGWREINLTRLLLLNKIKEMNL